MRVMNLDTMTRQEVEAVAIYDAHGVPSTWSCSCPQRMAWYFDANNAEKDLIEARRVVAARRDPQPRVGFFERVADWWARRGFGLTAL